MTKELYCWLTATTHREFWPEWHQWSWELKTNLRDLVPTVVFLDLPLSSGIALLLAVKFPEHGFGLLCKCPGHDHLYAAQTWLETTCNCKKLYFTQPAFDLLQCHTAPSFWNFVDDRNHYELARDTVNWMDSVITDYIAEDQQASYRHDVQQLRKQLDNLSPLSKTSSRKNSNPEQYDAQRCEWLNHWNRVFEILASTVLRATAP
jgi:hypothetical protein